MVPTLQFLEDLARQAGELLRLGLGQELHVDRKGEIDLVTEMDRRSEAFVLGEIQRYFPTHHVITEESGVLEGDRSAVWYIDPIDGTVNYAHGLPFFAISIAFQEDGRLRFGAVYDPMRGECFTAEAGRGAWVNGQPINVSAVQDLGQSLLVTGFPYDLRSNPENNLNHYVSFSLHSQGVRRLGSAAIDLCYVAAGRLDGFWEIRINAYDIAAGGLIAEQAGARVTDIHGNPDYLSPPVSILAAAPGIHAQMLDLLNSQTA